MSQQTTQVRTHEVDSQACPDSATTVLADSQNKTQTLCLGHGTICGVVRSTQDVTLVVYQGKLGSQWVAKNTLDITGVTPKADGSGVPFEVYVNSADFAIAITNASGSEADVDLVAWLRGQS